MRKHKVLLSATAALLLLAGWAVAQGTLRFTTATGTETFVAGITPGEVKCQGAQPNPVPLVYFRPCPAGVKGTVRGQVVQFREDSTDPRTTGLNTVTANANLHADGIMEAWGTSSFQVDGGGVWEGTWNGVLNVNTSSASLSGVGHGSGGVVDGLQLLSDNVYTPGSPTGAVTCRILAPGK